METTLQEARTELASRKKLISEYSIDQELKAMRETRESIEKKAKERSALTREQLPAIEQELDAAKADVLLNKVQGSNAESRRASLDKELTVDAGYQLALKQKAEIQSKLDMLDAEIDLEKRRYSGAQLSAEHKVAMLRVLGS